ncbi:MAG: hypothetical protein KA369_17230 [Spirochaetes bacterium]|nr:hypothetical protein [Spirochaetota bacterium]
MSGDARVSFRTNPFVMARERIGLLNPGQRRVLFGLVFFLFINAVILAVSIIVFSMLMRKL